MKSIELCKKGIFSVPAIHCRGRISQFVSVLSGRNGMELPVYHDLDALAGTWTDREADDFLRDVSDFDKVDENLWG